MMKEDYYTKSIILMVYVPKIAIKANIYIK